MPALLIAAGCEPLAAQPGGTPQEPEPSPVLGKPWMPTDGTAYPPTENPYQPPAEGYPSPGGEYPAPMPGSGKPTAFQVVTEGAALASASPKPLTLAFRAGERDLKLSEDLPKELMEAMEQIEKPRAGGLYLLIYGGQKPSGGYRIAIDEITVQGEPQKETMQVQWRMVPPDPGKGNISALTYPYLLAWVDSQVEAEQVVFEEVK